MEKLTTDKLNEILETAVKATSGRWTYDSDEMEVNADEWESGGDPLHIVPPHNDKVAKRNGPHIANCSPEVITAMVQEILESREVLSSIASKHNKRHSKKDYWLNVEREKCADVIAEDTRISRAHLAKFCGENSE